MKILVCVKHAVDEAMLRTDSRGKPQLKGAAMQMSAFDRHAIEAALSLRESSGATVAVMTMGGADAKSTLREALAMGAEKGFLVLSDPAGHDSLTTSYYLSREVRALGGFDLILCSEGSSDTYSGQLPVMMAEWLGLPYLGCVRKIELLEGAKVRCEESLEGRVDLVEAPMPAVLSVLNEMNKPRLPAFIQMLQASKKPIEERPVEDLESADSPARAVSVIDVTEEPNERKRIILDGTPEASAAVLVESLLREGVLKQ